MSTWTVIEKERLFGLKEHNNLPERPIEVSGKLPDEINWVDAGKVTPVKS